MKQTMKITTSLLLVVISLFSVISCTGKINTEELWKNATYTSNTTLGGGNNTVQVEISAGDRAIKLTINTDKTTLGEALFENGIVNDPLFFDTCNGIKADWNKDQASWAFYINDQLAEFGIGDAQSTVTGENEYKLVYTK